LIDNNYIFDEIENEDGGVLGDEHRLFEELKSFETNSEDKADLPRIIAFGKKDNPINNFLPTLKLAADSLPNESDYLKSNFLYSEDGKCALKFTKKLDEEIHIRLISESEFDIDEVVLYSPELNRYFVSNVTGDFIVGQYSKFNPDELKLKALFPKDKITLLRQEEDITAISEPELNIKNRIADKFVYLNLECNKGYLLAVIISRSSKHIIKLENNIVEIPMLLIGEKSLIFLY